jgi:hypothetical protein
VIDKHGNLRSGEDSNQYAKNIAIGLVCAVVYLARPAWLSERAAFWVVVTLVLSYNVIAHFRNHWAKPRFWYALVLLLGGHAALLGRVNAQVHGLNFWAAIAVIALEGLAMIVILGWVLGDNYFTRDARRERARAITQEEQGGTAQGKRRAQGTGGRDQHGSAEKNS